MRKTAQSDSERAKVPYELSKAIRDAVEAEYENPSPTQAELDMVFS